MNLRLLLVCGASGLTAVISSLHFEIQSYTGQMMSKWTKFYVFLCFLLPGSLSAMRFVTAVQEKEKVGNQKVEQVSRELWRRIWSEDKDITEPASLAEVPIHPWTYLFERVKRHCLIFFFCFLLTGREESRIVWKWNQRIARTVHHKDDQRQAEKHNPGSAWSRGQLFSGSPRRYQYEQCNKMIKQ